MSKKEEKKPKTKKERKVVLEVRQKTAGYIAAGFGVVAGLAWNDAIKSLIEAIFPATEDTVLAKLLYAAAITTIVVVVSIYVVRFIGKQEE
jgi:hypothetical protein